MNNNYLEQKKNTHLYFKIGDNKYAVNTSNVLEIMKLPALDYPQKLPNNIIGLLKYNNFVINVVDIRFYLNIDVTPYNSNNELLIVKTDEVIFGIITDKIIDGNFNPQPVSPKIKPMNIAISIGFKKAFTLLENDTFSFVSFEINNTGTPQR